MSQDKNTKTQNISRVALREHTLEDMEAFCELQMDPDVAQYVAWLPRTRAESERALLDAIEQQAAADRPRYFFAVALPDSGMIGSVGYMMTGKSDADCGWFMRKRFWGKGYASEAVRLMVSLAFADGRIRRLTASCFLANRGSVRVAEKCGFRLVGQTGDRADFEMKIL